MFCARVVVTCILLALSAKTFGQHAKLNSTIKTAALGDHPYMGYVYFPDASSQNISFYRAAVLVDRQHLITAAIATEGHEHVNNMSFPKNTLIARVGAVVLKTDNGDTTDDEETDQEREVIQLIQPKDYNPAKAWMNDIAIVKVLDMFKISPYVNMTGLNPAPRFHADEICYILVYMKIDEMKEEWRLQKRDLKIMGQSGCIKKIKHFNKERLLCANELNDKNISISNEGSCMMHAGGPLLCDNELVGIQTYFQNTHCTSPYAFQRIASWSEFIKCGLQNKCDEGCEDVCKSIEKDENEPSSQVKVGTTNTTNLTAAVEQIIETGSNKGESTSRASSATTKHTSALPNNENNEADKETPVNTTTQQIANDGSPIPDNTDSQNLDNEDDPILEAAKDAPVIIVRKSSAQINANVCLGLILFCAYLLI